MQKIEESSATKNSRVFNFIMIALIVIAVGIVVFTNLTHHIEPRIYLPGPNYFYDTPSSGGLV